MLDDKDLRTRRMAAEEILRDAGASALRKFLKRDFRTETKGMQDFVSEVDRVTETTIHSAFRERFPTDGFLGEESGGGLSDATWIVDPIDGTSNFVRGISFWCLSAALVVGNRVAVGVIYDPNEDEMFSAHVGGGCTLNGKPATVSEAKAPDKALLGLSFNFQRSKGPVAAVIGDLIAEGTSFRMMGAGALSLAHCAVGRTDGFWEAHMQPWDAAAGLILVAEAGGSVCDYARDDGFQHGNAVLVSTPALASYFAAKTGVALGGVKQH